MGSASRALRVATLPFSSRRQRAPIGDGAGTGRRAAVTKSLGWLTSLLPSGASSIERGSLRILESECKTAQSALGKCASTNFVSAG